MTVEMVMVGAPVGVVLIAGGVAAGVLLRAVLRDPGKPTTPVWQPSELSTLPEGWVPQSGRHRWDAERAVEQISRNAAYVGRHSEDEVPPSIAWVTAAVPVVDRARVLGRELGRTVVRPAPLVTPRARLVRLTLARRLKQLGVRDGIASQLVYRTGRGELP